jgi:hypothetical protein
VAAASEHEPAFHTITPLKVGDFVRPSVLLQGGIGVTDQDDLVEIIRQKTSDRTGLLVLVHVTVARRIRC